MDNQSTTDAARRGFEQSFAHPALYDRQTQDAAQLEQIFARLPVSAGMRILDLGTGSGYLAFAAAARYPDVQLTGLDIVTETLARNREKAARAGLCNLRFTDYGGAEMPFADGEFDMVMTRYALHHFPDIRGSLREISRILRPGGYFFLSDPAPDPRDTARAVDAYMQLKPDGHIRFYAADEWNALCVEAALFPEDAFESRICFPRPAAQMPGFPELMKKHGDTLKLLYALTVTETEVYITERVSNLLFRKHARRI